MNERQQSSIGYPLTFFMASSSNHISGVTGLSPSAWIAKSGSAFVSASGAVAETGSGWYYVAGHANDRSALGDLALHVAASAGADPYDGRYVIVPYDPFMAGFSGSALAEVNAEVVDTLNVDTYAELSSVPAATSTIINKLNWLYLLARNKLTQSTTTQTIFDDAGSGSVATAAISDSGALFTRNEFS